MEMEVGRLIILEEAKGTFWGNGSVLFLDLGGKYTIIYIWCILKIFLFYHMYYGTSNYTSVFKKSKKEKNFSH